MFSRRGLGKIKRIYRKLLVNHSETAHIAESSLPDTGLSDDFYRDIPIFINNRDLLVWPKLLVETLIGAGHRRITILDNDSAYPPLLAYYDNTPANVLKLGRNCGLQALFDCGILNKPEYNNQMYVYTDSDCIPASFCPLDFLQRFHQILIKHPELPKVGFSLCAWDWSYYWWEVEAGYFSNRVGDYAFAAPIDTTFALYRAGIQSYSVGGYRTTRPYQCRHMPWESRNMTVDELPEDYVFYILRANRSKSGEPLAANQRSTIARQAQEDESFSKHPRVLALKRTFSLDA